MNKLPNVDTDLCICGSGKIIKDCCLRARSDTKPPGPKTGLPLPECYARALQDCSTQISKEHFFSAAVSKLWSTGKLGKTKGFAAINNGEPKILNILNIRPKVLCQRHNNCLSGLDSIALKFFGFLLERTQQPESLFINGSELERWFLKVMCGMAAAGFILLDGEPLQDWTPPESWLDILFGDALVPQGCGLNFPINTSWGVGRGLFRIQAHFFDGPPKELSTIDFVLDEFSFIFTMRALPPDDQMWNRPGALEIHRQGSKRDIYFGWRNNIRVTFKVDLH
jgi:hypothetical protein